ncbi:MAG: ATP-binding protein [Chitinivibrionales bacterium]|nr:ATP-binding protein [Chitinivibrionales bacterium]
MNFKRILNLSKEITQARSIFLFGPRQTGKTFLLKELFPDSPFYNLLISETFFRLSRRPGLIREEIGEKPVNHSTPVIIDEIQKLPALLDEVQAMIDSHGQKFILTGSSARKMRRTGVNLLGGRAWTRHLFPLISKEIPDFDLVRMLNVGSLPYIYQSDDPHQELLAYCGTYLQEEIQAEAAVRRIDNFSRFLLGAALTNGEILNFEEIGRDSGIASRTVREYFQILDDTLIGTTLPPYQGTLKRKARSAGKFYFFDIGVCNTIAMRGTIQSKSELFGKVFEHFIFTELRAFLDYARDDRPLTFWRDHQGHEVDFIIGSDVAIEVKSTEQATEHDSKNLRYFSEEIPVRHLLLVSCDPYPRRMGTVTVLPWKEFLQRLWGREYS